MRQITKCLIHPGKTMLSDTFCTECYLEFKAKQDKEKLSQLVYDRFMERYILPVETTKGFTTMAICCLLMETLTAFNHGCEDTRNHSSQCFKQFFLLAPQFRDFKHLHDSFFKDIRCGILHQGETRNGWKIYRKGLLFDETNHTINAKEFINRLRQFLGYYKATLKIANWEETIWENLIKKMDAIVNNCEINNNGSYNVRCHFDTRGANR